jgi:coenzyme F420-reducing hydrogenase delta subunit
MAAVVGRVDAKRTEPLVVAFVCTNKLGCTAPTCRRTTVLPGARTSRVDVLDILKAFETGADGVAVMRCGDGNCKYIKIEPRVKARVRRGQELIKALGMEPERVGLLSAVSSGNGGKPYEAVCAEFSETVKKIGIRTK